MPKRITDRQRTITYAMQATNEQLQDMIETLKAISSSRFPAQKKERKVRRVSAQAELPAMPKE